MFWWKKKNKSFNVLYVGRCAERRGCVWGWGKPALPYLPEPPQACRARCTWCLQPCLLSQLHPALGSGLLLASTITHTHTHSTTTGKSNQPLWATWCFCLLKWNQLINSWLQTEQKKPVHTHLWLELFTGLVNILLILFTVWSESLKALNSNNSSETLKSLHESKNFVVFLSPFSASMTL